MAIPDADVCSGIRAAASALHVMFEKMRIDGIEYALWSFNVHGVFEADELPGMAQGRKSTALRKHGNCRTRIGMSRQSSVPVRLHHASVSPSAHPGHRLDRRER